MRRVASMLPLLTLLVLTGTVSAGDPEGHLNFFIGQKSLDPDDWSPADDQPEFAVAMSFGRSDWPVFIALDVMRSAGEDDFLHPDFPILGTAKFSGATLEIAPGIRKIWNVGKVRPYVGGGMALMKASFEFDRFFTDEFTLGPWLGGGVFWRLGRRFNLGFDVRWSSGVVDFVLSDDDDFPLNAYGVNVGGLHAGVTAGFGW